MPYFYDINRATTSNGTAGTATTHLAGKNIAAGDTLGLYGFYAASRFLTAGGAQFNCLTNTAGGTVFSGGTATTPTPKNPRIAAQSTWVNDASAITPGTTLLTRLTVGFAQTGGMGGYVPIVPTAAVQVLGGTTPNPVDIEFTSNAASNSVTFQATLDIGEGI